MLAAALALVIQTCSWENPGADPYMGRLDLAVESYKDLTPEIRKILIDKINSHKYDDIATIRRDSISGSQNYDPQITDMHFGKGRCTTVDRSAWKDTHQELGLVYCVAKTCVIVPTVCRNVSRITLRQPTEYVGGAARIPVISGTALLWSAPSFNEVSLVVETPGTQPIPHIGSSQSNVIFPPILYPSLPVLYIPRRHVPAIPEPSTWCMMLVGLASIFGLSRKLAIPKFSK